MNLAPTRAPHRVAPLSLPVHDTRTAGTEYGLTVLVAALAAGCLLGWMLRHGAIEVADAVRAPMHAVMEGR